MPLEATMMLIDNSEYMRNGDYVPTRFDAQADAVNTIFQTKIDANPENTVGIMSMAGEKPEVLVTHSKEIGHILQAIHTTSSKIGGIIDVPTSINIAQLALKHRENKNLRQRIIVFVGSPLEGPTADEKAMVKLAKKLKKNNVAVDVVCYGDGIEESSSEGKTVLKSFVENVSSSDNSHILVVPPGGTHLLSDSLISSPILAGDRAGAIPDELVPGNETAGPSAAAGGASQYEFGVDPSLDPELAMALRLSMQEAQAKEQAEAAKASAESSSSTAPADPTDSEEDALLQQAIAMSQAQDADVDMADSAATAGDVEMDEDEEDEDAAIARAIAMSMEDQDQEDKKKSGK